MISTLKNTTENTLKEIHEEMKIRKTKEFFLLFAMGSQFDHLIKQALEKIGVFCLVADPSSLTADDVDKLAPMGIIISGGPASVHEDPPEFDGEIFNLDFPTLGICLGFHMWAKHIGVNVISSDKKEFGVHPLSVVNKNPLFQNTEEIFDVLESHGNKVCDDSRLLVLAKN